MHPLVEFREMYDQYLIDGGDLSFKEFFDMIQVELNNEVEAKSGGITELNLTAGGASNGPGTGTSDSIPAKLSDGEFVMTGKAVRGFGNGSRQAGAKKLYSMMHQAEKNATG